MCNVLFMKLTITGCQRPIRNTTMHEYMNDLASSLDLQFSESSSQAFGDVPSTPTTIGITVTFMSYWGGWGVVLYFVLREGSIIVHLPLSFISTRKITRRVLLFFSC